MLFAPSIKKLVLQALEEHVIPLLQTQTFTHIDGRPPFHWDGVPHKVIRRQPLPDRHHHPLNFSTHWADGMTSRRIDRLVLRFRGASRERFGITHHMAAALATAGQPVPAGITELLVTAPAIYYLPPDTPNFGKGLEDEIGPGHYLVLAFSENELFLNMKHTHHLHIPLSYPSRLLRQYLALLHNRHKSGAQTVLTEMMLELKSYLETHNVNISNSAWPAFDNYTISIPPDATQKNGQLCHAVIDYIQMHLHAPLSMESIARHLGVSSGHLNRVFLGEIGITPMRFVTLCRLNAAKMILINENDSITNIAYLVGFSSLRSFNTVFKRHTGVTPSQYRRSGIQTYSDFAPVEY